MEITSTFASVILGLIAAITWGVGDFSGGLATRRARVLAVLVMTQFIGILLFAILALLMREPFPAPIYMLAGAASGLAGLLGVAALYRAMALGQMGIVAPVSGVISAGLPVIAGALTQGVPRAVVLLGFALALAGVWLISSSGHTKAHPGSVALAILAGLGFGGFLIIIAQVPHGTVFWPLAGARVVSLAIVVIGLVLSRSVQLPQRSALLPIVMAGIMDGGGNLFFVLAAQAGRLDVAGVLSSLYPATTVILALTLLHERLSRSQVAGVVLALIAIPLISMT